jgi:heptosyltransferase-2
VEYYLNLLEVIMDVGEVPRELVLEVNPQASGCVAQLLSDRGIGEGDPIIGLNPGAFYGSAKRWLPERFAESAGRLAKSTGWTIVVTGTDKERPVAEQIAEACGRPVVNLAGMLLLREAVALIDRFSIMLTNDSGAMHLAAARGVPMVAIFGPTDWRTTYPYHEDAQLVRRETSCAPCLLRECPVDHRCMTRVSVDEVVAAAEELIGRL